MVACVCVRWLIGSGWSVLVCAFVCAFVSAFVCSFRGLFACVLSWVEILCERPKMEQKLQNLVLPSY